MQGNLTFTYLHVHLPDHTVLLATFPLGPFLSLHLLPGTLYM